ncbi:sensor histidine kinase [Halobaculum sp. MBLA0143]|uniref:sensor histidine kinase n=1 Tax=Halobaculum sp. MBLA0143 TaxID=3079933 RepID=UPI0035267112
MDSAARRAAGTVTVLATGVAAAVAQTAVFPTTVLGPWRLAGLAFPAAVAGGVLVVGRLRGELTRTVGRLLFGGAGLVYVGAIGQALGPVVARPPPVDLLTTTVPLATGCVGVAAAVARWVAVDRRRAAALVDRERRAAAQRAELERQADRMESFAGVVSHDLRNPLEVARANLDVAAENGDLDRLDAVVDSLDRMEQIIGDALALARIGPAAVETGRVRLADSVRTAWDGVATEEATLELTVQPGTVIVADETYLRRLLENLFRNAVDHAGPAPTVTVAATDDGFRVDDDGPGVPPERRDEVTEAGLTTANDGTGFGLSIVDRIAAAHGWRLTVGESTTGGARFAFDRVEVSETGSVDGGELATADGSGDWAGGVREE